MEQIGDVGFVAVRPRGTGDLDARQVAGVRIDEVVEGGDDAAVGADCRRVQLTWRKGAAELEQAFRRPCVVAEGFQEQLVHSAAKSSHRRVCRRWSQSSTALGTEIAMPRTRITPINTGLGGSTESMLRA